MDEYDRRLFITLEADNITAEIAWNLAESRDRCTFVSEIDNGIAEIPSREPTPALGQRGSKYNWPSTRSRRILRKASCLDPILLLKRVMSCSARGLPDSVVNTSGSNPMHEEKDTSQNVTRVNYNGEALSSRNRFTWILFGRYKNIKVTLNDREKNELVFKVQWPKNRERHCLPQYEAHRDVYLEECLDTTPSLSRLGTDSLQSQ